MIVFVLTPPEDPNVTPPITPAVSSPTNKLYPRYTIPSVFVGAYLVSLDSLNTDPLNVTESAQALIDAWTEKKVQTLTTYAESLEKPLGAFLKDSTRILDISTDDMRIVYEATASATLAPILEKPLIGTNQTPEVRSVAVGNVYLYDIKEDKNYELVSQSGAQERSYPVIHPNSKNIIFDDKKSMTIADYDGTNAHKVYSGPYESGFFGVTQDGRILILTNLNPQLHEYGDLYAVGIR